MKNNVLYLVVPCYNEAAVLPETSKALLAKMQALITAERISPASRILFVDDGSQDATWSLIEQYHQANELCVGVKLSRNRGHQNALLAGLTTAYQYADVTISLDADLQDDIDAIDRMLDAYAQGAQIVYGVRSNRKKDHFLKRFTAQSFYKLMAKMGVETVYNHADYRLMSKTAVAALLKYDESNLFLRGLIPQLGFPSATVEYERKRRTAGESKYSVTKMFGLALDGITSFSIQPLLSVFWVGVLCGVLGLAALVTTLVLHLVIGLGSLWVLLSALAWAVGIILTALGLLGIYLGKVYGETKHRPHFIIEKELVSPAK